MKINHKEGYYNTCELAEILGFNCSKVRRKMSDYRDSLIVKIDNYLYLPADKLEAFKKTFLAFNPNANYGNKKRNYWKYSEFDDKTGYFIVKKCGLSKYAADKIVKEMSKKGVLCRITPHIKGV